MEMAGVRELEGEGWPRGHLLLQHTAFKSGHRGHPSAAGSRGNSLAAGTGQGERPESGGRGVGRTVRS
jgi:hypothetical protein